MFSSSDIFHHGILSLMIVYDFKSIYVSGDQAAEHIHYGALLAVVVGHFSGLFLIFISIFLFLYLYVLAFLGKYIFGKFVHKSTQKERVASYLSNKFWSNWRTTVASLENWKDKFQRKNKCNVINAVPAWQQIIFPAWPEPRLLRRHILELEIWPFFLLMTQCLLEVLSPLNIGSFYFTCLTVLLSYFLTLACKFYADSAI